MSDQTVTVKDILQDADAVRAKMSKHSESRRIIERLQLAVIELAQRHQPEATV